MRHIHADVVRLAARKAGIISCAARGIIDLPDVCLAVTVSERSVLQHGGRKGDGTRSVLR